MNREAIEHVIRAAGAITASSEMIILGSQAILGTLPQAPASLLTSVEVALYPKDAPELADLIDGSIGEASPFHETFGYYAHGVGPETARLPKDWETRLVALRSARMPGITGWCLSVEDLAASKLAAGREKDIVYVTTLFREGLVQVDRLQGRVQTLPPPFDLVAGDRLRLCLSQSL